jgi:ribose-phosphate pyrophosphokinase
MTGSLIIPMPGNEPMATELAAKLGGDLGVMETRRFPDSEAYLRFKTGVAGRALAIICTLDQPDEKFLRLAFAAAAARDLGAASVGLVAPYLAYMRQDRRFKDGEAVTSREFARLISSEFDWLVTVDPHLHRYTSLGEVFTIPSRVAHAAPALSTWIRENVARPLVIGPDSESEQWVSTVASHAGCPYVVLNKRRFGDRDVKISVPDLAAWLDRTPVLIDDIVSSAGTMIEACREVVARGLAAPTCIAIHALFSSAAYQSLKAVSARVVTTNAVGHETNEIDITALIAVETAALVAIPRPLPPIGGTT